jgi:TetR/AcrR family transcriptional regulator, lmrAB and yxaGH operons repressor
MQSLRGTWPQSHNRHDVPANSELNDNSHMRKQETVQLISHVFRRHGYDGATMSALEEATGLGRSSLYHHFPDGKEGMARDVIADVELVFAAALAELTSSAPSTSTRLKNFGQRLRAYYADGHASCLLASFGLTGTPRDVASRAGKIAEQWIAALAAAYRESGMTTAAAKARAESAVTGLQGALILANATGDTAYFDRALKSMCAAKASRI